MKKHKKPIVSVIMPVYNAGPFLVEAIESIRKQTVHNVELFIVDDASTDNSWKIIKRFVKRDKRIKAYRNKTNKGLVKSLNFLIPKTRGEYVARMDADDVSLPDRFARQIRYLETHPTAIACGGQEKIINEAGKTIAHKYFPTDPKNCYRTIMNFMVIQPPLLMARGYIFRALRYDNHLFRNDDITLHFKLLRYGDFGNVNRVIFKYRMRANSVTHTNPKAVYFRALLVRINAILVYGYRPALLNVLMAILESLVVFTLPTKYVLTLFERIRFRGMKPVRLPNVSIKGFFLSLKFPRALGFVYR